MIASLNQKRLRRQPVLRRARRAPPQLPRQLLVQEPLQVLRAETGPRVTYVHGTPRFAPGPGTSRRPGRAPSQASRRAAARASTTSRSRTYVGHGWGPPGAAATSAGLRDRKSVV